MDFGKQVKARCPRFLFRQVFRRGCIDAAIHKELTDGFADGAVVCCSWVLGEKFIPGHVGKLSQSFSLILLLGPNHNRGPFLV